MGSLRHSGARARLGRLCGRAVALVALVVALVAPGTAAADRGMLVGASDDAMKWHTSDTIPVGAMLSLQSFRITLPWHRGQTALTPESVGILNDVTYRGARFRIVLSVFSDDPDDAPTTEAARADYCTYVRNTLARYPIDDVVIWNEPNLSRFWRPQFDAAGVSAAPAAYEALLSQCYDVLHGLRKGINVIAPATAPRGNDNPWSGTSVSHSPVNFIYGLGRAYRASGRKRPIFDTVGHHAYGRDPTERPWRVHEGTNEIALGDWGRLMDTLREAFDGTGQPTPGEDGVTIWYLENGYETKVPAGKGYTGVEPSSFVLPAWAGGEPGRRTDSDHPAPDQATQLVDSLRLAYCEPYVGAYFNFLLFDENDLTGWQSGVLYRDGTRKPSWEAFESAIAEVLLNRVNCGALKGGPAPGRAAAAASASSRRGAATALAQRHGLTTKISAAHRTVLAYRGSRVGTFGFARVGAVLAEAARTGAPRRRLAHRTLRFRIGDLTVAARTDARGVAMVPLGTSLLPGSYLVRVAFAGDAGERSARTTVRLQVRNSGGRVWSPRGFRTGAGAGAVDVRFDGRFCGGLSFDTGRAHVVATKVRAIGISPKGSQVWLAGSTRDGSPVVVHAVRSGRRGDTFELWLGGERRSGRGAVVDGSIRIGETPLRPRRTRAAACAAT